MKRGVDLDHGATMSNRQAGERTPEVEGHEGVRLEITSSFDKANTTLDADI